MVAVQNVFIFVFGGLNGLNPLAQIEKYDCLLDSWSGVPTLLREPLSKIGVVSLAPHNQDMKILIFGGQNTEYQRSRQVQLLRLEDYEWEDFYPMNHGRIFNPGSGTCVLAFNFVYVLGGSTSTDGGEMFNM